MGHDRSLKQSQSLALSGSVKHAIPRVVCHVSRAGSREKEDPTPSKDLLYLWFFSLSPIYNLCSPPWSIKGRVGHPTKGRDQFDTSHTTLPTAEQQPSSRYSFNLSIRDLGPVPLSTVCTPYYEPFSANNTSSSKLDVGTFCPNQYKPCVF